MPSLPAHPRAADLLARARTLVFLGAAALCGLAFLGGPARWPARPRTADGQALPYGARIAPQGGFIVQDFSVHRNYLRQIRDHAADRPYRLEDQEGMFRRWLPLAATGEPHAYSPAALLLSLPWLSLPPRAAFTAFTLFNIAAALLLLGWGILPRVKNLAQAAAVLAAFAGQSFLTTIMIGQSSVLTTCGLACGWFLLRWRQSVWRGLGAGAVLWALAAKPSAAVILLALVLGARAWLALGTAVILTILSWLVLAGHYGGLETGVRDYLSLLGRYHAVGMTPFMAGGMLPQNCTNLNSFLMRLAPGLGGRAFFLSQVLFAGSLAGVTLLRWAGRISLSEQFQALLLAFLLFCPHLGFTEDWAICLFVAEGAFFREGAAPWLKAALVAAAVYLHGGWVFPAKLILSAWWLAESPWRIRLFGNRGSQEAQV